MPAFVTAEIPELSAWLVKFTVCETAATGAPDILEGTVNVPDIVCETGATGAPAFVNDEVPDPEFLVRSVKVFDMVCEAVAPGTPSFPLD